MSSVFSALYYTLIFAWHLVVAYWVVKEMIPALQIPQYTGLRCCGTCINL